MKPGTDLSGAANRPALLMPAQEMKGTQFFHTTLGAANVGEVTAATPASGRDRVYSGDQTSNTVSIIDPATNTLLGIIRLGDPAPGAIQPLYKSQLLIHGLGFSPDHKTLDVISIGSNSVTLIDTATNAVKGTIYVGRLPHEGFFTPSGKQLWVAVRGEDYVSVIAPVQMKETRRIQTTNGPGMVLFSPDGRYAYVPSSFTPELDVVDTHSYRALWGRRAGLCGPGKRRRHGGNRHADQHRHRDGPHRSGHTPNAWPAHRSERPRARLGGR